MDNITLIEALAEIIKAGGSTAVWVVAIWRGASVALAVVWTIFMGWVIVTIPHFVKEFVKWVNDEEKEK